jgi:acyl-coenzyme A synthetase/AMP-(fatty) acid ligase
VKAIVVARPGSRLDERAVRRHCASCLEEHMVPAQVEFRAELPKNERGKIARQAL